MNSDYLSGAAAMPAPILPASRGVSAGAAPLSSAPEKETSVAATPPASFSGAELDAQAVKAAGEANDKLRAANVALQFQVDLTATGSVRSVKLLDSSERVVMQFPTEQMLAVRDNIDQMIQSSEKGTGAAAGALFSKTA